MKILIIANHLLTSKIASGGDRVFVEIMKRWKRWAAKITLIAPEVGVNNIASEIGVENTIVTPHSPFDELQRKAIWAILPLYLHRTLKIFKLLHLAKADVLYTPGDFFCDVVPAFYLKRKFGAKWIANIYHINEPPFVRKGNGFLATTCSFLLQRFSFSVIKRGADIVFLNNQKVKDGLVGMGFHAEKLFVTGLGGVDFTKIKDQSATGGSKIKNFEGCFLGRLNPTKGIFDLPKIWKRVVEELPEAKLVIIGGGERWLDELWSQIQSLGLDEKIKITGFVSEEEKYNLLGQSKVFVFPSYEEGWGMAVAEAMAAGLPVVAYDLPAYREVFPNASVTVGVGDIEAMSKAVLEFLQDKDKYETWQKKGYNVVQKYDLDKIADSQWKIILGVINR